MRGPARVLAERRPTKFVNAVFERLHVAAVGTDGRQHVVDVAATRAAVDVDAGEDRRTVVEEVVGAELGVPENHGHRKQGHGVKVTRYSKQASGTKVLQTFDVDFLPLIGKAVFLYTRLDVIIPVSPLEVCNAVRTKKGQ